MMTRKQKKVYNTLSEYFENIHKELDLPWGNDNFIDMEDLAKNIVGGKQCELCDTYMEDSDTHCGSSNCYR